MPPLPFLPDDVLSEVVSFLTPPPPFSMALFPPTILSEILEAHRPPNRLRKDLMAFWKASKRFKVSFLSLREKAKESELAPGSSLPRPFTSLLSQQKADPALPSFAAGPLGSIPLLLSRRQEPRGGPRPRTAARSVDSLKLDLAFLRRRPHLPSRCTSRLHLTQQFIRTGSYGVHRRTPPQPSLPRPRRFHPSLTQAPRLSRVLRSSPSFHRWTRTHP